MLKSETWVLHISASFIAERVHFLVARSGGKRIGPTMWAKYCTD